MRSDARPAHSQRFWIARAMIALLMIAATLPLGHARGAGPDPLQATFEEEALPLLQDYCYGCHGNGLKKGQVSLDAFETDPAKLHDSELWFAVLKNVRAGLMPPEGEARPSDEERRALEVWIKREAFGLDPADPDPGRVTVRRLNRVEYQNTIRDLIGVDFKADEEFPPDDTGHGFDNIGDVLSISPLLLEKYLTAARSIVSEAVPTAARVMPESIVNGRTFRREPDGPSSRGGSGSLSLSYYEPAEVSATVQAEHDGRYRLDLDLSATERFLEGVFDANTCRVRFRIDGDVVLDEGFARQDGRPFSFEFERDWRAGPHTLALEIDPSTPGEPQVRSLEVRLERVTVLGPLDPEHWVRPPNYRKFFPKDVPGDEQGRLAYARELLEGFATRAFRRPVDRETLDRLVGLADRIAAEEGRTFEAGVGQAMAAVLTSPRFLFREEGMAPGSSDRYPLIDESALASRLSYFLWSTMPDDELFRLAANGKLREHLPAQVDRMLADRRSEELIENFVGQWLQSRDIEGVNISASSVLARDRPSDPDYERRRERFRELYRKPIEALNAAEKAELDEARKQFFRSSSRSKEFELTGSLRRAMRKETELLFDHILREDRSLLELLDADYTFLNERLARHYGIEGVRGDEMRKVVLPPDSPRGGVLTMGTVLAVTSNPDRTSPVKRGLYILDNLLGSPPPPPPPDIPSLEEAGKKAEGRSLTLRESMELHRDTPMCASCHARMDPLGLALENFNALGLWRDQERGGPIDASGRLVTGESFEGVRELKRILVEDHRADFYRCLTEKLLTYALGRGLEASDIEAVDQLVGRLEARGGRASDLVLGIVESAPFQRRRRPDDPEALGTSQTASLDPDEGLAESNERRRD